MNNIYIANSTNIKQAFSSNASEIKKYRKQHSAVKRRIAELSILENMFPVEPALSRSKAET